MDFMGSASETEEFNPKTDLGPVKQSMTLEPRVVCIRSRLLLRGPPHDTYGDIWDVGSHPPNSPSLAEISIFIIYDYIYYILLQMIEIFHSCSMIHRCSAGHCLEGNPISNFERSPTVLQDVQLQLKVSHAIILQSFDDESRGRGEARPRLQLLDHGEPSHDSHGQPWQLVPRLNIVMSMTSSRSRKNSPGCTQTGRPPKKRHWKGPVLGCGLLRHCNLHNLPISTIQEENKCQCWRYREV